MNRMNMQESSPVPETLEGWYLSHEVYSLDWPQWWSLGDDERAGVCDEAVAWLQETAAVARGDSALYSVLTQKGDLMFLHYRETIDELGAVEFSFKGTALHDMLLPSYSYLSVIEVSLYEAVAMANRKLSARGLEAGSDEFKAAFEGEMKVQRARLEERLYRDIPPHRYICFYPMNKRRGETLNWYTLPLEQRRAMMRDHGRIGHKYHETVVQVIGGSVGLDDWEWGVSLHSDDPLAFKKLVYEMRFDPASALYAEFGPFYVGIRRSVEELTDLLSGEAQANA